MIHHKIGGTCTSTRPRDLIDQWCPVLLATAATTSLSWPATIGEPRCLDVHWSARSLVRALIANERFEVPRNGFGSAPGVATLEPLVPVLEVTQRKTSKRARAGGPSATWGSSIELEPVPVVVFGSVILEWLWRTLLGAPLSDYLAEQC